LSILSSNASAELVIEPGALKLHDLPALSQNQSRARWISALMPGIPNPYPLTTAG
jgi:hypothetical protein